MSERRINVAQAITFNDGTMQPAFRDFIFRVDDAISGAGLSAGWGNITGTLSDQTDLQAELDGKSDVGHTHVEADILDLDKYTQAEVDAEFAAIDPQLLPVGGTLGQALIKVDATDYNVTWGNVTAAGSTVTEELAEPGGDPLWDNVTALWIMEVAEENVVAPGVFSSPDASTANRPITLSGATIVATQSRTGSNSLYFDGTGDRALVTNSQTFVDATLDYAHELSIRTDNTVANHPSSLSGYTIFSTRPQDNFSPFTTYDEGLVFDITTGDYLRLRVWNTVGGAVSVTGTTSLSADTDYDIALNHDASAKTYYVFINGAFEFSLTYTGTASQGSTDFKIGNDGVVGATRNFFYGWIDEWRTTRDALRNTTAYTVSIPFPTNGSTAYTINDDDVNNVLRITGNNADVTLPTGITAVAGDRIWIRQAGTGTLVFTSTGVTINGTLPTWSQHTEIQLRYVNTDEWDLV